MITEEEITESWDFWCYYEKTLRNKETGAEIFLLNKRYIPVSSEVLRIGTKIEEVNSTEEIKETYLLALKPNILKMCNESIPFLVYLKLFLGSVVLDPGNFQVIARARAFANPDGLNWDTDTNISFDQIKNFYIPFDMTEEEYENSLSNYEVISNIQVNEFGVEFLNLEQLFWKFLQKQIIGVTISAIGGYCDVYSPSYLASSVRPFFYVRQFIQNVGHQIIDLDTEIKASSKVKGVCRDKDGNIIIGSQCLVVAFHIYDYRIIGSGYSSSIDGSFLIDVERKVGYPIIVSFIGASNQVFGTEIMITVSGQTV